MSPTTQDKDNPYVSIPAPPSTDVAYHTAAMRLFKEMKQPLYNSHIHGMVIGGIVSGIAAGSTAGYLTG